MITKDSTEYGWLVIKRKTYEALVAQEYAGTGTPLHPDRPGYWVLTSDPDGATVLYTGVTVEDA